MNFKTFFLTTSLLLLLSCEFDKSVNKNLITGLKTAGNGLSCNDVYLTSGTEKINKTTFIYGEKFNLNFENITGFKNQDNFATPGMEFLISSISGDTLMHNPDLYAGNKEGFNLSPLLLLTTITTGDPLSSGGKYELHVNIWDKKGEGSFAADLDFDVIANPKINIESDGITYDEIYLYSNVAKTVLFDNTAKFDEEIYVLMEGLNGFTEENGLAYLGVRMHAKDAANNTVVNEADLMGDSGLNILELRDQLAPNFIFNQGDIKSPVSCEILVWDKRSDHKIKTTFLLNLE